MFKQMILAAFAALGLATTAFAQPTATPPAAAASSAALSPQDVIELREEKIRKCLAARDEAQAIAKARARVNDLAKEDRQAALDAIGVRERNLARVRAELRCDGATKPVAHNPVPPANAAGNADAMRSLAAENSDLRAQILSAQRGISSTVTPQFGTPPAPARGVVTTAPATPVEGVVYQDGEGNTFERHLGGSRECRFLVNGVYRKSVFAPAGLDKVASKKYCDLQAAEFHASMTPTTPESPVATPAAAQPAVSPAAYSAPADVRSTGGTVTCDLKFNGQVVKTSQQSSDDACKAWTLKEAAERGWIPAPAK